MERANEAAVLADADLQVVNGGGMIVGPIVGTSVESQQRAALQRRLTEIYLSNHPIDFRPHLP
jgi:hypothetical protein